MEQQQLQAVFVVSDADGQKFKLVMQDVNSIAVHKLKRYLEKSTHIQPDMQIMTYNGVVLRNEWVGSDFGLVPNSTIRLSHANVPPHVAPQPTLDTDPEGRQRQLRTASEEREAFPSGSVPTNLAPEGMFERAARLNRMTSPRMAVSETSAAGQGMAQGSSASYRGPATTSSNTSGIATHPLGPNVAILEEENRALKREIELIKRRSELSSQVPLSSGQTLMEKAKANLLELGKELGLHLQFDASLTCVIGKDEKNTIIVTLDAPTERLYVYSTLLTFLPDDPSAKLHLYEVLLEGAMLGRDMAGGCVGISVSSGIVMLSTTIDLKHCDHFALRDVAPQFVEALVRWRNIVAETLPAFPPSRMPPSPPRGY